MTVTKEQAARILGMKAREVVAFDHRVATLLDGTRFEFAETADGVSYRQLQRVQPDGPRPRGFVTDWTAVPGSASPPPEPKTVDGDDATVPPPAAGGVPVGTAEEVLAWVGDDKGRAAQALAAETAAEKPRSVLVGKLEKLAAG